MSKAQTAEPTDEELRDDLINQLVELGVVKIVAVTPTEYHIALTDKGVEMCGDLSDIEDWEWEATDDEQ